MESEFRGSDELGSAPTTSDIVLARPPAANAASMKSQHSATTASDTVFAGTSDIVCVGPSAVSVPQNSTRSTTTASDIMFVSASALSEPQKGHGSSDTVFAAAPVFLGRQNHHENAAGKLDAETIHSKTHINKKNSQQKLTTKNITDDRRQMRAYDFIKGLFELFDTDNDGYLTTDDLKDFFHVSMFYRSSNDLLQYAGPSGKIDFPIFLKLVQKLGIDLDKLRNQRRFFSKFVYFVRARVGGGFVPGSALRTLVIEHYINFAEKRCKQFISKKKYEAAETLKWIFNNTFDDDGEGYIEAKELTNVMRIWDNKELSLVNNIISEVDAFQNEKFVFADFLNAMKLTDIDIFRKAKALKFVPLLKSIFNLLDDDDDGHITNKGVETFKHIWKTDPDRVENYREDEVAIAEDERLDFPAIFNLFPLRLNSFYSKDFEQDAAQLEYIFSLLDVDGDGCLSVDEVKTFTLVLSMMPSEAKYIIDKVEAFDPSKTFKFSEVQHLLPIFEVDEWEREREWEWLPTWTPVQHELITQLYYAFSLLDEDKDGRLSRKQFETLLRSWRLHPLTRQGIFNEFDYGCRHGTVSFPEFLGLLYYHDNNLRESTQDQGAIERLINMVRFFDKDDDGCLTREQVEILTLTHMPNLKQCDPQDILEDFDARGERTIDFPNLLSLLYPRDNDLYFEGPGYHARCLFDLLDRDGDGYLSTEEVDAFARVWKLSPVTTQDLINKVGAEWNGSIDFLHLYHTMVWMKIDIAEKQMKYEVLFGKLLRTFYSFDEDNDGLLTANKVKGMLELNPEKTGFTFNRSYADGNEVLDFDNFLKFLFSTDIDPEDVVRKHDWDKEDVSQDILTIENEEDEDTVSLLGIIDMFTC